MKRRHSLSILDEQCQPKYPKRTSKHGIFESVPREVLCYILQFIPPHNLFTSVALCSKYMQECVLEPSTWHNTSVTVSIEALSKHVPTCRSVFGRCKLSGLQLTSSSQKRCNTTCVSAAFESLSTSLSTLRLHKVIHFEFVDMISILKNCRFIKSLELSHTVLTSHPTIVHLPELSLEHLVLEHVNSAESNWLENVLEQARRNLKSFSFVSSAFNDDFSDTALKLTNTTLSTLLRRCTRLELLKLHYCDSITDDAFLPLLNEKAAKLSTMQIVCCPCITESLMYTLSASISSSTLRDLRFEMVSDSCVVPQLTQVDQPLMPFTRLDSLQVDTRVLKLMLQNKMFQNKIINPAMVTPYVAKIDITDEFSSGDDVDTIFNLLSHPQFAKINYFALQTKAVDALLSHLEAYPCIGTIETLHLRGGGVTLDSFNHLTPSIFSNCRKITLQNFELKSEPTIRRVLVSAPSTKVLVLEECHAEFSTLERCTVDDSWCRADSYTSLETLYLIQNSPCVNAMALIMSFSVCYELRTLWIDGCTIPSFSPVVRLGMRPHITTLTFTHTQTNIRTWILTLLLCPNVKSLYFVNCKVSDKYMIDGWSDSDKQVRRSKMLAHIGLLTHDLIQNCVFIAGMTQQEFIHSFSENILSQEGNLGLSFSKRSTTAPSYGYSLSFSTLLSHLNILSAQ